MIHELKTLPEYFEAVIKGEKLFEVRKFDRPFQKGDMLALNEYDKATQSYTGRSCLVYVDYILAHNDYCKNGYAIMSIKPCLTYKSDKPYNSFKTVADYSVPLATSGLREQKNNAEEKE